MRHLSDGAGGDKPKKRRRKQEASIVEVPASGEPAWVAEDRWLLRLLVVRSLHRCFLYDTVGFLDQDKFDRVLSPLVSQLESEPPAAALALMSAHYTDVTLDSSVVFSKHFDFDAYGKAAVACLTQLAVTAGNDAYWKPLNHQALMATRSASIRTRCLGLEVVAQMVERLREEYLVLLPETIPFLAELLEDTEVAVEARAQEVVKQLEEVSGEKLDQYLKT